MGRPVDAVAEAGASNVLLPLLTTYWSPVSWVLSGLAACLIWPLIRFFRGLSARTAENAQAIELVKKDIKDNKDTIDREVQSIRHNCDRHQEQLLEERRAYRADLLEERRAYRADLTRIHERIDESNQCNQRTQELMVELLGGRR